MLPWAGKQRSTVLILALILAFIFSSSMPSFSLPSDGSVSLKKHSLTLMHGGIERNYFLYEPRELSKSPCPLLLLLHGGGGNARHMLNFTGFDKLAAKEGIIVVCPDGVEKHWNDGRAGISWKAHKDAIDDVGFLREIIDKSKKELNVDSKRVFVAGISNGAMMSYRLALEIPDRIAAIGAVVGALPEPLAQKSWSGPAVPAIIINGSDDPLVPFNGGEVHFFRKKLGRVISVKDTVAFFAKQNSCSGPAETVNLKPKNASSGFTIQKTVYKNCSANIEAYVVEGGGHTWFRDSKLAQYLPAMMIGKNCKDIDTTELIWNFFKKQELKQSATIDRMQP